jgi:hypothetical protein
MNYAVAANVVGGIITLLVTYLGRETTLKILDLNREKLVDENRAPTNEEVEALMRQIEADVDA